MIIQALNYTYCVHFLTIESLPTPCVDDTLLLAAYHHPTRYPLPMPLLKVNRLTNPDFQLAVSTSLSLLILH